MQRIKHLWTSTVFVSLTLLITPVSAMEDMNNNPTNIETLGGKGKWTVVEVWASDCRMCQLSAQHIVKFKDAHPEVTIIGISVEGKQGKANAQKFIDEQRLTFPNLLSEKTEIDQYLFSTAEKNFIGTPTFLFYDPQGTLVTVQPKALTEKELGRFIDSQSPQPEIAEPC